MSTQAYEPGVTDTVTLLDLRQVAAAWGVSVLTVRRLVWRHELEVVRVGSQLRFTQAALDNYLERHREAVAET